MSKVNIRALTQFVKMLEPMGDDHVFTFHEGIIRVKSIEGGTQIIGAIQANFITGVEGDFGIATETLKSMLPVAEEVEIAFGKQWEISAPGFKSKVLTLDPIHCCRVPKKDMVPKPNLYHINPQEVYDRINSLKKAFGKGDTTKFSMKIEPNIMLINFSDSDSAVGEMENSVLTTDCYEGKIDQIYAYDTVLKVFQAVRLQCKTATIRFMEMPGNDGAEALMLEGDTDDVTYPINFRYVIAPRIKQ